MKEKDIQRYCLRYLKAKGYYFGRVNTGGIKRGNVWCKNPYTLLGVPDIMGFCMFDPNGYNYPSQILDAFEVKDPNANHNRRVAGNPYLRMFVIECKSTKGKLSEQQVRFKEYFETSGGLYLIVRKPEDIEEVL